MNIHELQSRLFAHAAGYEQLAATAEHNADTAARTGTSACHVAELRGMARAYQEAALGFENFAQMTAQIA